ncbi:MAG: putative lipid II flippase FtsW [Candidatus Yanofskybacteria bacterium]|nr:putative lipid II flippase FtsW [Candidatus Yanofskybacteria bacterium]
MSGSAKKIIIITFVLIVFGLLALSSAGIVDGQKRFGSDYYYFVHQLLNGVLPGLFLFFVFSKIKYKFWKKISLPLLIFSLALLLAVFIPRFGFSAKGATRWISLGFLSFQPSEILKFSLIVYFAAWFSGRNENIRNWSYSIVPFFVVLGFVGLLLALQPDVGTLGIIALIALSLYFFAGAKVSHFGILILVLAVIFFALVQLAPYRFNRFLAFFNPTSDPQGISYHINQALIAIGRGGIWGVGFGQSQQKINFLPEPVGDSIFAVVAEELGLIGAVSFIFLIFLLSFQLVKVANNTSDRFGQLFILGMMVWIGSQSLINIGAITGLLPLTGIPLPFVSYGGTSIAALLAGLGIAVNIAKAT